MNYTLAHGPSLPPLDVWPSRLRLIASVVVLGALPALLVAEHHLLLTRFARLFRVDDPAPADAIVVLLGGWQCRPVRAAALYNQGIAPIILLSGAAPIPYPDVNDSALNVRVLRHEGVPAASIVVLPLNSTSTREEAEQVREYVRTHPIRRIVVVTTAFHTARARWIFERVLRRTAVEVRMAAADDPRFNEQNWYTNQGLVTYSEEAIKRLYYSLVY